MKKSSQIPLTGKSLISLQDKLIKNWHKNFIKEEDLQKNQGLLSAIHKNAFFNFSLWHTEDEARRTDVTDKLIADVKRNIDRFNQLRNNAIEDRCSTHPIPGIQKGYKKGRKLNSETPGSICDRLFIIALRIFHMDEETKRADASPEHIQKCKDKLKTLKTQRTNLAQSLDELMEDYMKGKKSLLVYFQMKMYNDPSLNPALYKKNAKN